MACAGVVPVPLPVNVADEPELEQWEGEVRTWSPKRSAPRVEANQHAPPVVILPGFGNNTADYAAPFGNEEASLVSALKVRPLQNNMTRIHKQSVSLSLSLSLSLSFSPSPSRSRSYTVVVSLSLSLSVCVRLCVSVFSLSRPRSHCLSFALCRVPLCFALPVPLSVSGMCLGQVGSK
jgi:hypothetical protein